MTNEEMYEQVNSDIEEIHKIMEKLKQKLNLIYPAGLNINDISVTINNKLVFIMSEYRKNGLSFFGTDDKSSQLNLLNEIILVEILFLTHEGEKYLYKAFLECDKLLTIMEETRSMPLKESIKLKLKDMIPFTEDEQIKEFTGYCDEFAINLILYKNLENELFKITIPDFIVKAINHYLTLSKFANYSDQGKMDFLYTTLYDGLKLLKLEHIIDDLNNTGFDREFKMY